MALTTLVNPIEITYTVTDGVHPVLFRRTDQSFRWTSASAMAPSRPTSGIVYPLVNYGVT